LALGYVRPRLTVTVAESETGKDCPWFATMLRNKAADFSDRLLHPSGPIIVETAVGFEGDDLPCAG
jgi:hypothetical protein